GLLDGLGHLQGIDAVVHTGDASEDGTAQSYRLLHEILDPFAASLDAPLVVVMGNHDVSALYGGTVTPGERLPAVQDRVVPLPRGGRLIALDSSVPGAGYGHLAPEQLDWLREQLAVPAAGGSVLAIHHPPLVAATSLLRGLDPLGGGADERALALSGASLIELGGGAPRVISTVLPNAGDVLKDPERPVYRFDPAQVARILEAAGR